MCPQIEHVPCYLTAKLKIHTPKRLVVYGRKMMHQCISKVARLLRIYCIYASGNKLNAHERKKLKFNFICRKAKFKHCIIFKSRYIE